MGSGRGDQRTRLWRKYADIYRPGIKRYTALKRDADLKGYFDSIPHTQLLACLGARVVDRSVLKLIRMWMEALVVEESKGQGGGSSWSWPTKERHRAG